MNPLSRFFHRRKVYRRWRDQQVSVRGPDPMYAYQGDWDSSIPITQPYVPPPLTETAAVHPYFIEESDDNRTAA